MDLFWIDAAEALAGEFGLPQTIARLREEDLVVRIEGALAVCAGSATRPSSRTFRDLRESVLTPVS